MAMASAVMSSNSQKRKKRPSPIDTGGDDDDGEFDNPLASASAADTREDFQAAGGELAEYGEGYDDKFSSSQIFQKLETEASVSPPPPPPPPLLSPPPYRTLTRRVDGCAETPRELCADVCADGPHVCRQSTGEVATAMGFGRARDGDIQFNYCAVRRRVPVGQRADNPG